MDALFQQNESIKSYPFVCKLKPEEFEDDVSFKIVISVPKRIHRSAVQRNRIRRLIRESLRLNKHLLEEHTAITEQQLALFLIYTSADVLSFELMNKKVVKLINKITESKS